MKVSHGPIAYGARRCKDARAREVRSMERRVEGDEEEPQGIDLGVLEMKIIYHLLPVRPVDYHSLDRKFWR